MKKENSILPILVAALLIFSLALVSTVNAETSNPWSANYTGGEQNNYTTDEVVYVQSNSCAMPDTYVDVYVVNDSTEWPGGENLAKLEIVMKPVQTDSSGQIPLNILWSPLLTPGNYDIIVDTNRNGIHDSDENCVDDYLPIGFQVTQKANYFSIPSTVWIYIIIIIIFIFILVVFICQKFSFRIPWILIFVIVIGGGFAYCYGLSQNPGYHGWNPLTEIQNFISPLLGGGVGQVRNCIRSVMSGTPECSDNDGTLKASYMNGKYVGLCRDVSNDGTCVGQEGQGTGNNPNTPNCPRGTHQVENDCVQNSADDTGTCSSDDACKDFGTKHCGGSTNTRCGSDNLCHCCFVISGACAGCNSCGGSLLHCERGMCVHNAGGKITD